MEDVKLATGWSPCLARAASRVAVARARNLIRSRRHNLRRRPSPSPERPHRLSVLETSGQLKGGESVLVHAAPEASGYLAVQLAKLMGASPVIATASTRRSWTSPASSAPTYS